VPDSDDDKIKSLAAELVVAAKEIITLEAKLAALKAQLNEARQEGADLRNTIEILNARIESLVSKMNGQEPTL
jgi:chromosome segregation ATPase